MVSHLACNCGGDGPPGRDRTGCRRGWAWRGHGEGRSQGPVLHRDLRFPGSRVLRRPVLPTNTALRWRDRAPDLRRHVYEPKPSAFRTCHSLSIGGRARARLCLSVDVENRLSMTVRAPFPVTRHHIANRLHELHKRSWRKIQVSGAVLSAVQVGGKARRRSRLATSARSGWAWTSMLAVRLLRRC